MSTSPHLWRTRLRYSVQGGCLICSHFIFLHIQNSTEGLGQPQGEVAACGLTVCSSPPPHFMELYFGDPPSRGVTAFIHAFGRNTPDVGDTRMSRTHTVLPLSLVLCRDISTVQLIMCHTRMLLRLPWKFIMKTPGEISVLSLRPKQHFYRVTDLFLIPRHCILKSN